MTGYPGGPPHGGPWPRWCDACKTVHGYRHTRPQPIAPAVVARADSPLHASVASALATDAGSAYCGEEDDE